MLTVDGFEVTWTGPPSFGLPVHALTRRFKLGRFLKLVHAYAFTCKMSISTCQMEDNQERPLTPFNILKVAVSVAVAYPQGAHPQSLIAKRQLSAAQRPSFRRK